MHNLYMISDSTYFYLLLLTFLLISIYILVRFVFHIIHYLKKKKNIRQIDIAI